MPRYCASEACNQLSTAPTPHHLSVPPSVSLSVCLSQCARLVYVYVCACVCVWSHAPHMPSSTYTYACSVHGEKGSSEQSNVGEYLEMIL